MFIAAVRACIDAYAMLPPGARVIVAVSGGPDSMALLSALYALRLEYALSLVVAHVNHQLRGDEARHDAVFVEHQAVRFGLPFYQTEVDVKAYQHQSGLSPQHAARQLRYAFFHALHRDLCASHIALGHTADDQAETLLIRLLRGSGPASLAGMPAVRSPFIRPLIQTSRREIFDYLRMQGIPWIIDSSNTHRTYLRNRIRLDLMPVLRQINPRISKRLNELTDMLRADNMVLEQQTDALVEASVQWRVGKAAVIRCEPYREAPLALQRRLARRLLDALLTSADTATFHHVEALRGLIADGRAGRRLGLPGQLMAERHLNTVRVWNARTCQVGEASFTMTVPGVVTISELGIRLTADVCETVEPFDNVDPFWAYLDLDRLQFPLTVRFSQPGDRFFPLGAPGRKKLKAFFIDQKIPRCERPYIPLIMSGDDIAWVVGYRIAELFKVCTHTQRIARLRCGLIEVSGT